MFSKVSFEVFVERKGEWFLETQADEEEVALSVARNLTRKSGDYTSVKVMKNTTSFSGNQRAGEIFKQKRDASEEAILVLTGSADNAPLCHATAECYQLPARMALARLLRLFLERFQITPTELLHGFNYLKKFDDTTSLIGAFFYQVSVAQAKRLEQPQPQRLQELMGFYKEIHNAARSFNATAATRPKFDAANPEGFFAGLQAQNQNTAAHNFFSVLTQYLLNGDFGNYPAKLNFAVALLEGAQAPTMQELMDSFIADCLMMADMLDSLVGRQYSFNDYLLRLIEIVRGDVTLTKGEDSPALARLRPFLNKGVLPQTKIVLTERIVREVRSDNLLNKREPDQENNLFKKLEGFLKLPDGNLIGGTEMAETLAGRKLRERKRKLRELGLDDVADSLQ